MGRACTRNAEAIPRCSGTSDMKGVVDADVVCAEKHAGAFGRCDRERAEILSSGNYQEMLSIAIPKTVLPEFEALIQRARARGDERGSLRTVAAKPENPATEVYRESKKRRQ